MVIQMITPKVILATVAMGHWYPRGVERMLREFERVSPGYQILPFIDMLPSGAPLEMRDENWDYTGYSAKPFALNAAMDYGADIGILLDASFYPIRPIQPLVDHIAAVGYYFCDNGFNVGQWCNDAILERHGVSRDDALGWPDLSSYCVGLDFRENRSRIALRMWCEDSLAGAFVGPHTNVGVHALGRNVGWCSNDPRCRGHRHDQASLSLIAYRLGMTNFCSRPRFTAYKGSEDESTCLIAEGMGS